MLKLILGISGTGKSTMMLDEIRTRAHAGQKSILLVPEQYTSTAEAEIYAMLGDRLSGYVMSCSFTSLGEKLQSLYGGLAVKSLTAADRAVLVRRALAELGEEVKFYRRHRNNAAFYQMAVETIDELKSAGLNPESLLELSHGQGSDRDKMEDLAKIWAAYEALIADTAMDPGDRLLDAAERMEPEFFADTAVFVDEFDTFNAPKKRLLERILTAAPQVTVALCCDGLQDYDDGIGTFSGAKALANRLLGIAHKNDVPCAAPTILTKDLRHGPALTKLNELLAGEETDPQPLPELTLTPYRSRSEEAKAVAAQIRRLAEQGVPYQQMAVICRKSENYLPALRYEFRLAGIPMFCDEATTPEHTAPAQAVRAALSLMRLGLGTMGLTGLLKTGLCDLPEEQQCALENYAYTWQPSAAEWREPFTRSPEGYNGQMNDVEKRVLALAEEGRIFLVSRAQSFLDKVRGAGATEISRQLYFLLKEIGAEDVLARTSAKMREQGGQGIPLAREVVREWNIVMELLNQMALLLGDEALKPFEYDDLFCLLLRSTDLGHIPQSLDAVIVTTAPRMRVTGIRHSFVVGLAEGEFPQAPDDIGLLTHADRDALIRQGVEMPDCFENRTIREKVCFYKALTVASEGVWLSWSEGGGLPCTSALADVTAAFAPQPAQLTAADYAATPAAALDYMGQKWQQDGAVTSALWQALADEPDTAIQLDAVRRSAQSQPFAVQDRPAMSRLLGSQMRISPSRVEKYYNCPFAYFLQYVLKLRPRRRAELSPDVSGSLVHWVLENTLRRSGDTFTSLTEDEVRQMAVSLTEEYVDTYLPTAGTRFAYLVSRLKKNIIELLLFIQKEQQQGSFRPVALELNIGNEPGSVPPVTLQTPDGHKVQVIGQIDRVDALDTGDQTYLRVLDYKTGDKDFNLQDVYCGLDCQMLLYLFALERGSEGRFTSPQAAGVLYLMADPAPTAGSREEAQKPKTYHTDGLILDDEAVLSAMDSRATGLYVPFRFKKDGSPYASKKLADVHKLERIRDHVDQLVVEMAEKLYQGRIEAEPLCKPTRSPCQWCDFRSVCCHQDGRGERGIECPAKPFEEDEEVTE